MSSDRPSSNLPSPDVLSFDEAAALVAARAAKLSRIRPAMERVQLGQALGRVLAKPIRADSDQPPFARSTRDGFACRAAEASTHTQLPIAGTTRAGEAPAGPLPRGAAWEIMTGAPVPKGADAVAMLEHVKAADGRIYLLPPRVLKPGENVVAKGAQARNGDQLLAMGTVIGPSQVALAATCGRAAVDAYVKPRVAILATGDELVSIESSPGPGQIRNSNAPMLAAMVEAAGGAPWVLPVVRDTNEALDAAISQAAKADLIIITGGVSAGKFDLVEPALARAGARFHFTGVKIQPGKPTVFGELPRRGKKSNQNLRSPQWFFGLPGNPVSSAVTFLLFASPVLAALSGRSEFGPRFALARLSGEITAKPGLTRFLPAVCSFAGPLPDVQLVSWQGSGDIAAMARANCFVVVPDEPKHATKTHLKAGAIARILLT
jgi:molybdopterin molybdotransferase